MGIFFGILGTIIIICSLTMFITALDEIDDRDEDEYEYEEEEDYII